MSQAAVPHIDDVGQTEYSRRLFGYSPGKFAMWLFIGQYAMGFVGLISTYIILRSAHPGMEWVPSVGTFVEGAPEGLPHLALALDRAGHALEPRELALGSGSQRLSATHRQRQETAGAHAQRHRTHAGAARLLS